MVQSQTNSWSNLKKISFRFAFSYITLYVILVNNGAYPFWYYITNWLTKLLHSFIPWAGKNILYLSEEITNFTNGSGDTTYDYIVILSIFIASIFSTIIWSLIDRKRKNYSKLFYWITTAARYYVGLMLISYGLWKIIKLQFPYPSFYRLIQPYGESSPMGLAWTFLGFSKGYNLFMGIAEVAAVFLLFRRTATIGAIITLMTAINVMAVNYFYDIPVKIVSTHLVLLTLFILAKDFKKLYELFFKGTAIQLVPFKQPIFKRKWLKISGVVFKYLILLYCLGFGSYQVLQYEKIYGNNAPKPKLYGLYRVDNFISNNDTIPPILNHNARWQYIRIEKENRIEIFKMDKERLKYQSETDTINHIINLKSIKDTTAIYKLNYSKKDSILNISTIIKEDTISLKAKRLTKDDFLLTNRGFNWINETPFNK